MNSDTEVTNSDVLSRIYGIYHQMFVDTFGPVSNQNSERNQLKAFGWTLFLLFRSQRKSFSDDYERLFSLILICFEFMYISCVVSGRKNMLKGLYLDNMEDEYDFRSYHPICVKYGGTVSELIPIKEWFLPVLYILFLQTKVLRTKGENPFELFNDDLLHMNSNALDGFYTTLVSKTSCSDGRKYLELNLDNANEKPGVPDVLQRDKVITELSPCVQASLSEVTCLNERGQDSTKLNKKDNGFIYRLMSEHPFPLDRLVELFRVYDDQLLNTVIAKTNEMSCTLSKHLQQIDDSLSSQFLIEAKTLYYKILYDIMSRELKIKNHPSCLNILTEDVFHCTLFVCCVEIMVYLRTSKLIFLQLLTIFKIHGFHFFKIIEIIAITEKKLLPCNTIKHLNTIEEYVLDKISWENNSPLWNNLEWITDIPNSVDVDLPHEGVKFDLISATEPRDMNTEDLEASENHHLNSTVKNVSNKKNPLFIFFKKLYYLAAIRVKDLLDKLNVTDKEIRRKIWTVFEYVITQKTEIMRDRHLDQILLCTIYAVIKKSPVNRNFIDIINCYRLRPQTSSDTFRDVLISHEASILSNSDVENGKQGEIRGDIITFYNNVFVTCISNFMEMFCSETNQQRFKPSPMPLACSIASTSSRRISGQHSVYIRDLDHSLIPSPDSPSSIKHYFYKSPSKNLEMINNVLRSKDLKRRKKIADDIGENSFDKNEKNSSLSPKRFYDLMENHCEQVTE